MTMIWKKILQPTTAKIRFYRIWIPAQPPEQTQFGPTQIFDRDILLVSFAKFHAVLTFRTIVVVIWT